MKKILLVTAATLSAMSANAGIKFAGCGLNQDGVKSAVFHITKDHLPGKPVEVSYMPALDVASFTDDPDIRKGSKCFTGSQMEAAKAQVKQEQKEEEKEGLPPESFRVADGKKEPVTPKSKTGKPEDFTRK